MWEAVSVPFCLRRGCERKMRIPDILCVASNCDLQKVILSVKYRVPGFYSVS
jgi:hypothetical protein